MSKGKISLGNLAVAFLIMSGILVGISIFNSNVASVYGQTATNISFTNVSEIEDISKGMYEKVNTGISAFDFIGWVWNAGLLAIRSFTGIITVFTSFIAFISGKLGVPSWFLGTISAVGAFAIIYAVANALLKKGE